MPLNERDSISRDDSRQQNRLEHAAKQHDRDDRSGENGRPDGWPALLAKAGLKPQ